MRGEIWYCFIEIHWDWKSYKTVGKSKQKIVKFEHEFIKTKWPLIFYQQSEKLWKEIDEVNDYLMSKNIIDKKDIDSDKIANQKIKINSKESFLSLTQYNIV